MWTMNTGLRLAILALLVGFCYPARALDPLFASDKPLNIELAADFSALLNEKDKATAYPAKLVYSSDRGDVELDVELFVRGNFRLDFCQVPGLRVVLRRPDTGGLFDNQRKLKLVTQCQRKSSAFERYLLQEYAIYRMYESLSPYSFKTRLVDVTYIDTGRKSREWQNPAFFIENKHRLARRHDAVLIEKNRIRRSHLALAETNLVSLFQYMIANTDYSMLKGEGEEACCHNLKLLNRGEGYIPVPYDFDFAGLINASYAGPSADLHIRKVTQRLYRGFCRGNLAVPNNVIHLRENKENLYSLFSQQHFESGTVKKAHRFLDKFYETIDDPSKLEKRITGKCRPEPRVNL